MDGGWPAIDRLSMSLAHEYPTDPRLRHWQRRIFVISWLTYASFYLCRVNLAVALPLIQAEFGWGTSALGLIGSAFLWTYALGQLINGALGQKADARWFVGTGMLVSSLCNAGFGASGWLWLMTVLWGLNGWAQSMGWGPIMKTIGAWFGPNRRGRIAALFSPCFVLGHLVAWSLGGWVASRWGWRYAFWLPAIVFAGMAAVWLAGIRSAPEAAGTLSPGGQNAQTQASAREILRSLIAQPSLRWAALTCVFASMIKDGLNLWTPTFLIDALGMPVQNAAWTASVLPLCGLAGSFLAGGVSDRFFGSREAPGIIGLSLVVAVAMVGLIATGGSGSVWITVALLGVSGMAVYGINSLLLTSLPLSFSLGGHVGAVAGFLDFASYVGGGISALAVGLLLNRQNWNSVFLYWLVATLIALGGGAMLARRT